MDHGTAMSQLCNFTKFLKYVAWVLLLQQSSALFCLLLFCSDTTWSWDCGEAFIYQLPIQYCLYCCGMHKILLNYARRWDYPQLYDVESVIFICTCHLKSFIVMNNCLETWQFISIKFYAQCPQSKRSFILGFSKQKSIANDTVCWD